MLVRLAGSARKFSLAHVAENELGGFDLVQLKTIAYLSGALACTLTGAGISTLILFDSRTSKSIKESEARTAASIKEVKELIKESLGARGKGVESSSKRSGWWSG